MPARPQNNRTAEPPGRAVYSASADLAAAAQPPPKAEPVAIYGSVSTQDIATAITALLASDSEGARVVLGPEDVNFTQRVGLQEGADMDRVKMLGEFEIAINVKGGHAVTRTVRVNAQDSEG